MYGLSIVIPVYNEAENISILIPEIEEEVLSSHEIIIVYDDESDNTIRAVENLYPRYVNCIKLVKNQYGNGVLNAIKTGFDASNNDFVLVMMADLSDSPKIINKMLEQATEKNADIICASRYMPGGRQIGAPFIKSILSRLAGLSLFYFAGIKTHDSTNNFKMYKKSFLKSVDIESESGFELALELIVKAHFMKKIICEIPTLWRQRISGKSRFQLLKWLPSYIKWYFKAFGG